MHTFGEIVGLIRGPLRWEMLNRVQHDCGTVIAGSTRNPMEREIPDQVRDDKEGMTRKG